MPRPALGRVRLTIRLHPAVIERLGPRPSARARELLEKWSDQIATLEVERAFAKLSDLEKTRRLLEQLDSENASSDVDESAPLEEGSAAKLGPGRSEVDAETEVTNTTRRR